MKKISVIGHFGEGKELFNGQTIKTKIVTEELQKQFGQDQVLRIDTHGGWKALFKAPFQVFYALKNSMNIIIFPAHNGLRIYAPLLSIQRNLFENKRLHYVVIGGWLPQFLTNKKTLAKCLKRFDAIYVETRSMKNTLEKQGFNNIYVMPNAKKLKVLSEQELFYPQNPPYKFCTFSRVMKEKGIEDAVNAVIKANTDLGYQALSLDIYGQIDSEQTEWFENLRKNFPEYIRYAGVVPFDESVTVLKEYFALLFPTYYDGEGFAGTLLDAYSAGLPVIASDWKYNSELVNINTGYLYPVQNHVELVEISKNAVLNPEVFLNKKTLCLAEANKYRIDVVIQILVSQINNN